MKASWLIHSVFRSPRQLWQIHDETRVRLGVHDGAYAFHETHLPIPYLRLCHDGYQLCWSNDS